jgi:peroxiredoxin
MTININTVRNNSREQNNKTALFFHFFSAILLTVTLTFTSCMSSQDDFSGVLGMKAPAFSLYSIDGKQVRLFDYKNKVIVLFFFGSNCSKCKAEVPCFEEALVNPYKNNNDYVVLGLDYWNSDPTVVKAFKDETGISIPLLLDAGNVGTNYKTFYNRIVVIDKSKNVVFSGTQDAFKDVTTAKIQIDYLLKDM